MMLVCENLSASYGRTRALVNLTLKVHPGQIVCILGANGAGKSTCLNSISGMVEGARGLISADGVRMDGLRPDKIVARGVVQVPEGREIFPEMTVLNNLRLGTWSRMKGMSRESRKREFAEDEARIFEMLPRLKERATQLAGTLSGGEQQMLMIGRALMARPKYLLLDEPSLGLSPVIISLLFSIIRQLNQDGLSILLVEQNARLALAVSSYGYVLENGECRIEGPSEELKTSDSVRRAYLGD